jgi:hypothetical protein
MATARSRFGCAALGTTLYVAGGAITDNSAYDPSSDSWTARTPMDGPLDINLMGTVNGDIFVVGFGNLGPSILTYAPTNEPQ